MSLLDRELNLASGVCSVSAFIPSLEADFWLLYPPSPFVLFTFSLNSIYLNRELNLWLRALVPFRLGILAFFPFFPFLPLFRGGFLTVPPARLATGLASFTLLAFGGVATLNIKK